MPRASDVSINSTTNRIYVGQAATSNSTASIAVLDSTTRSILTAVDLPNFKYGLAFPRLAVDQGTNTIYASTSNSGNSSNAEIDVIDGKTNLLYSIVRVAYGPRQIVVNDVTKTLYATSEWDGVLSAFEKIPCGSFGITPTSRLIEGDVHTGSVSVTGSEACYWTAISESSWITVTGGWGVGNGFVGYSVPANLTSGQRSGTIAIGGRTFTLTQAALVAPVVPTDPYPSNGATGLPTGTQLQWTGHAAATSYDLYFGASTPPPFLGKVGKSSGRQYYRLPYSLSPGTKYYWRVEAKNSLGSTSSAIWSFTTRVDTLTSKVGVFRNGLWYLDNYNVRWDGCGQTAEQDACG